MAKRFIDTDLFRKPLMRSLQAPYKALWVYLFCECDHAGVWDVEMDVASMRLGSKLDQAKCLASLGVAVVQIDEGRKWWLPEFVAFQYGNLNPANKVHASVIAILSKYGIDPSNQAPPEDHTSSLQGAKDKDKDKDKDKEEGGVGETSNTRSNTGDIDFEALWLTFERYGAKGKAFEYWKKLPLEDREAITSKAPAYVASTPGGFYRYNLEGWINPNERRWERPIRGASKGEWRKDGSGRWIAPSGRTSAELEQARSEIIHRIGMTTEQDYLREDPELHEFIYVKCA